MHLFDKLFFGLEKHFHYILSLFVLFGFFVSFVLFHVNMNSNNNRSMIEPEISRCIVTTVLFLFRCFENVFEHISTNMSNQGSEQCILEASFNIFTQHKNIRIIDVKSDFRFIYQSCHWYLNKRTSCFNFLGFLIIRALKKYLKTPFLD